MAGFYEELIDSLQKFNLKALSLLFKREWYEFYVYVNGRFLTLLFSGVIISYFSVSLILDYLIKYYEIQVLAVFFGMILASLYFVYHEIDKWKFKTILFFHGNAGKLDNRVYKLNELSRLDVNYLILAYRGFSGNKGSPSEKGLYIDSSAAKNWLNNIGVEDESIILYGCLLYTSPSPRDRG